MIDNHPEEGTFPDEMPMTNITVPQPVTVNQSWAHSKAGSVIAWSLAALVGIAGLGVVGKLAIEGLTLFIVMSR